jgi:hypothetical protein
VEYIVACFTSCEAIWLQMLLTDLFDLEMEANMILCDNIVIRYHFIHYMMQRGYLNIQYVGIDDQVANQASISCKSLNTFKTSLV